ncbi:hypothetical protein CASFOL_014005 [Castilleja foliolosa]|uniref:F-box domain-containing protein n=1 Tax=Castilleja foliolosa TaxID=1961234 RepID=A0ABD3DLN7_9LAMI
MIILAISFMSNDIFNSFLISTTKMQKSAEIVASNEHLLIEILLRMPVKPLFRFKSVSTQWLHLISSQYFSKNHTLKNPNPSNSGLLHHNHQYITYISPIQNPDSRRSFGPEPVLDFLKLPPLFSCTKLLTSCNGLLLYLLVTSPHVNDNSDIIYIVCNPTTKKSNPLPYIEDLAKRPIVNMDLAFDPQLSLNYKVVCTRYSSPSTGSDFDIQIFSSETGSWKICQGPFKSFRAGMLFQSGVYWNKRIHYIDSWDDDVIYFDLEDETLKALKMPAAQSEVNTMMRRSWYLERSGGYLHLLDIEMNITRASYIGIYELLEDYSGWVLRFRVDLSVMESTFPRMVQYVDACPFLEGSDERGRVGGYYTYWLLGLVRMGGEDDENVGFELILSMPNRIMCYNVRSGDCKEVVYYRDDRDRRGYDWNNVVGYVDTLSPV